MFNMIGNMHVHLKTMEMQGMWRLKKESGDFTKGTFNLDEWLKKQAEQAKESTQENDEKLSEILAKYYAGKKLSSEERVYLRDHAPQVYKEMVSLEEEQKAYERELRRCETKEEVERLKMTKINGALATVNAVANNPNISDSKKMEIITLQKRRVDGIEESTREFVESGEYAKLPTEAEVREVEQDQMEERKRDDGEVKQNLEQDASGIENDDGEEVVMKKVELKKKDMKKKEIEMDDAVLKSFVTEIISAQNPVRDYGDMEAKPEDGVQGEKAFFKARENVIEKIEVDPDSQEERNVRSAKAKAAYAVFQLDYVEPEKEKEVLNGLNIRA